MNRHLFRRELEALERAWEQRHQFSLMGVVFDDLTYFQVSVMALEARILTLASFSPQFRHEDRDLIATVRAFRETIQGGH